MATLGTTILYKILYILTYVLFNFILIFAISLSIYCYCRRRKKKSDIDHESNKKDWELLRSFQKDVDNVLKSGSQMNNKANVLWQNNEHQQEMTAQLQKSVADWYEKSMEDLPNSAEFNDKSYKSKDEDQKLRQMVDEAEKIHRNLDKLKDKIRNLQVRPIDDERQALVQKEDKKFVEDLIAGVQKVDNLIPEVKKEDKDEPIAGTSDLPGDIKAEIQSFTLYWAPFRAFLIDLQSSGLETKTEKAWLEEAKEIINKAQHAIDKFIKNTRKWKWMLSYFSNQKARTELKEEMKRINTGFEKFLERKERFGIQFKRYSTRRETDPLQSVSETSQEQASNNVQISENGRGNFNNELEKLKKTYEKSLKMESLERLQALCTTFTNVHGEAAEKEEGIKSSTEEENPAKKLHEKFDKIKGALEIIEETTKAYKFDMGVVGLDEDIQTVASQLITGNKHVVCVVGMKGIGKTTLAKNIYRHSDILEHFPARAWVTLTDLKTNDYDAIFKDVAKQVSEPDINGSQEEENRRREWKNKVCDLRPKSISCSRQIEINDWSDHEGKNDLLDNLRKFFAFFFSLFPRDYEIPARRLVALSIAEGLGLGEEGRDKNKTTKLVAMDYLSVLIDLNLIQAVEFIKGKVKTCRLPSALEEQFLFESKISQDHLVDLLDQKSEIYNDIHIKGSNSPKFQQSYRGLISYLSFDTREVNNPGEDVGKFLRKGIASGCFHSLKVLDLEHVFRPQLPNTIGKLVQLMYLGLRWTYLEEITSSIGNLLNLQTLDVKYTYVRTLPKSIWKLQKLQHLYLNESHRSKFVSQPRSSSLKNLKTLWGLFLDDFNAIKNGLNKLNNLTKLGLAFQLELPQQEELAHWVKGLKYLKSLRLRSVDENGGAQDLHLEGLSGLKNLSTLYLFGKLEIQSIKNLFARASEFHLSDLTLSASGLKDDPMQILGSLSSLKSLCFYSDSYEGKQMLFIKKSFSELQVLRLWNLKNLEKLKVEEEAMQKLRELEIRGCKSLMVFNGLKHLTSLRELKLPNMEDNFTSQVKNDMFQIFGGTGYPPTITGGH
ncbi:disease resistance protein RPM1-like [Quercus lobata]|uniref:disease resistance protein RPM1-like n=1 Tax=Quercus lobata TaxID=97700 RepID=UPI001245716D|nr:disease resistance protein RPM1-like [Quercus lobata]